jgi:hypothetical protein
MHIIHKNKGFVTSQKMCNFTKFLENCEFTINALFLRFGKIDALYLLYYIYIYIYIVNTLNTHISIDPLANINITHLIVNRGVGV